MKKWLGLILVSLLVAGLSLTSIVGIPGDVEAGGKVTHVHSESTGNYDDGFISDIDSSWDTVHHNTSGTMDTDDGSIVVRSTKAALQYAIYRGYLYFNTAFLGADAVILSASLWIYVTDIVDDDGTLYIRIQNGMPDYPSAPLDSGDYYIGADGLRYSGNLSTGNASAFTDETWNVIDFYGGELDHVNKTGYTKLCLRELTYDIFDYAPSGSNNLEFDSADGTNPPYLLVEYIVRPTCTSSAVAGITANTATLIGGISDTGGADGPTYYIDYRGFVWDTTGHGDPGNVAPLSSGYSDHWTDAGTFGVGAFTHGISSLISYTDYYYRAYAYNVSGWAYSPQLSFKTLPDPPSITLSAASNKTNTTARLNGEVTSTGKVDPTVTVYWGKTDGGTTAGSWTFASAPTSPPSQPQTATTFYKDATSLDINTLYYFRAAATNTGGTTWAGPTKNFTTTNVLSTITTSAAGSITNTTATLNGNVTGVGEDTDVHVTVYWGDDDGGTGTWDFNGAPEEAQPQGIAAFSKNVTSLSPGVTYYFSAKAVNKDGTSWATTKQFDTTDVYPTVTTQAAGSVLNTSAQLNGNITNTGGDPTCNYQGFAFDNVTHGAPGDVAPPSCGYDGPPGTGYYTGNGSYGTGAFLYSLPGLTPHTTYFYRAYAHNSSGWVYGDESSFTTAGVPIVTTSAATLTTETSTIFNGAVTSISGATVTVRGFDYGLTNAYGLSWTESGSFGVASYSSAVIPGLTQGTHYYFRAKAYNTYGWGYGAETTVVSLPEPPTNLNTYEITYTTVSLSWTPGAHAAQTMLRYDLTGFPADPVSAGTEAYFNTGDNVTLDSLTPGGEYYFRCWSWVSGSDVWSDGYSQAYIVMPIPAPQALKAKAVDSHTVNLWWLVADNMTSLPNVYTVIMAKVGDYPADPPGADIAVYNELTGDEGVKNFLWTTAEPGTPYFFMIWFYNSVTDNYTVPDSAITTTPPGFGDPLLPDGTGMFTPPDASSQINNPLDGVVLHGATIWGFQHGMMWAFLWIIFVILVGMYLVIKSTSGVIGVIGMLALFIVGGSMGICAYWLCVPFTIMGAALSYVAAKSY